MSPASSSGLLLAVLVAFAGSPHGRADDGRRVDGRTVAPGEGLRRITHHLIPALAVGVVEPPLEPRRDLDRCAGRSLHASWVNPFSPLPKALASRHVRLTQTIGPSRVSARDSFILDAGHRLLVELTPEQAPRLELAWRQLRCGGRARGGLQLRVTVADGLGETAMLVPLEVDAVRAEARGRRYVDFESLSLPLPAQPGVPMRLGLEVVGGDPDDPPVVALAEPVVTGLPTDLGASPDAPSPGQSLNLLWIVIDAVRHDALGPGRIFDAPSATPNLDRIFAEGTTFTEAYTLANQTRTSTVAMLSSTAPSIGGFHSHTWGFATGRLDGFYAADPPLLPRILERHGWRVSHYGHNLFVFGGEDIGVDHGFPSIIDFKAIPSDAVDASSFAMSFFEQHRDTRWALMLNYTAPHTPYRPPEAFAERAAALPGPERLGGVLPRNYVGELMWVDHNLGPVFQRLEELGLDERTIVVVTADHGEVMRASHDCFSALVGQACGFNHSLTVYDEELRVPLAIRLPHRIAPGHVVDGPVSQADLAPTLLELLGLPAHPRHSGVSQREALEGGAAILRPVVADGRLASALIHDGWKLIVHSRDDDIAPRARAIGENLRPLRELFDLRADPLETENRAGTDRERVDALVATLASVRAEMRAAFTAGAAASVDGPTPVDDTPSGGPVSLLLRLEAGEAPARLHWKARVVDGDSLVPGAAMCSDVDRGCAVLPDGEVGGELDAAPGAPAVIALGLAPAAFVGERRVVWTLEVDGASIPADAIRLGRYGLAFFRAKPPPTARDLVAVALTADDPYVAPRERALYLVARGALPGEDARVGRVTSPPPASADLPGLAPEEGTYDKRIDRRLGRDMRRVLRELGYSR
jgi:arylsulfatase A-like enzyme